MKEITTNEIALKLNNGESINIIDVREDDEVAMGIIPTAKHIPLGQLGERVKELNKEDHYYIVCHSGGRSSMACQVLEANGYNVTNIAGGMLAWEDELEF
ncbi:rhodanese-like domain-containing protein [Ornithinibacillus halophilus]|uniref:Rhodanese-related sulfurtransferase n=1 Tax=Ornithinibacillus halophilus TaxID=930117 RepID=A0A1M5F656_9BACI|nr:rhodanese-like domain-containing protein [Ornithinibacillus halophilus]SHF86572.1 Rhodanese-related sulfurtransferase [Ornithinibacillus halophilus]